MELKRMDPVHLGPTKEFIKKCWESENVDHFPGPQPISIERRHFPMLKTQPYLVCEKTDGTRYMLACFTHENLKICALTNRAFQSYYFPITIPRDTILDGELTETRDGKLVYMVYDAVIIKGVDLRQKSLTERLEQARAVVRAIIKTSKILVEVKVKPMYPSLKELPPLDSFPYNTDGIVFTPINEKVRIGTHETMFKWKPREHITVDFCIRNFDRTMGWELHIKDKGEYYKQGNLYPPDTIKDVTEGAIIECGYGKAGWYPVRIRSDKNYPNNRRTYSRTIVNLREDIKLEEFLGIM